MAIATDHAYAAERARSVGSGLVLAGDRTRDFRAARRHSLMVRVLRGVLPVSAVGLVGIYILSVLQTVGWVEELPQIAMPSIVPENLTMHNPKYEGFNKDGGNYVVTAKTAVQDLKRTNIVRLNGIVGDFYEVDKTKTNLTATSGVFDSKTNVLELHKNIRVVSSSGLKATLTRATVNTKESLVVSKEPVLVEMKAGSVRANEMTLRQKLREVTFAGSVVAHLKPEANGAAPNAAERPARAVAIGDADAPVDVTAQRLDIRDNDKVAIFSGDVVALQGEARLTTPELEVTYTSQDEGATNSGSAAFAADGSKLRRVVATAPVVMTQGTADRVTCEKAEIDVAAEKAVLTGSVVMTSGADRRAVGDRAELDGRADTVVLTGDVQVMQGQNQLKGRRLMVDRTAGRTQLTAPTGEGVGNGRISAHLVRTASVNSKPAPAAKTNAPSADAASDGIGVSSFKTDPSAPIDVESDTLDVDDKAKVAVFRGKVEAVQGGFRIAAAELEAHYKGDASLADAAQSGRPRTGDSGQAAELTQIKARREVVVTSSNGQKATGDWAEFDVATNKALVGGNVLLTQGKNVVRGDRLAIDMTTGQSVIQSGTGEKPATPGTDGWSAVARDGVGAPARSERPSATFYLDQNGKAQVKGRASSGKSTAPTSATATPGASPNWAKDPASSWDAITGTSSDRIGN